MTSLHEPGERNFNAVSHKPTRAQIQSVFESWRHGCLDATKSVLLSVLTAINLFKIVAQECKKSTSDRRASLKNVAD